MSNADATLASSPNQTTTATPTTTTTTTTTTTATTTTSATAAQPASSGHATLASAAVSTMGKVWLITCATSPIGFTLAREALANGDSVAAGCSAEEYGAWTAAIQEYEKYVRRLERRRSKASESPEQDVQSYDAVDPMQREEDDGKVVERLDIGQLVRWGGERCLALKLDIRKNADCQSALAYSLAQFSRIDILVNCSNKTFAGTLEESSDWHARAQLEISYFGPVNMIKTVLSEMRRHGSGHIINITGLTGHMGTPGLSIISAGHHAIEGFSEAMSFEIAPFNIKLTIVQPSLTTYLLTHPLHLPPPHPAYTPTISPAASKVRSLLKMAVSTGSESSTQTSFPGMPSGPLAPSAEFPDVFAPPTQPVPIMLGLVAETARMVMAVAGKDNPPSRIIVGSSGEEGEEDGVESVKERMKMVSEELEEFLECGLSVDVGGIGPTSTND